jgi:hypothetical protein
MFRELLLKFGLVQPTSSDIINKLFNDNFTKKELNDLLKLPAMIVYSNNSNINSILLYYSRWDECNNIKIQHENTSDFEDISCSDLAKYLPEIMDAIKEVKLMLPNKVFKYNECIRKREESQNKERTCRTKLWEYINSK